MHEVSKNLRGAQEIVSRLAVEVDEEQARVRRRDDTVAKLEHEKQELEAQVSTITSSSTREAPGPGTVRMNSPQGASPG